MSEQQPIEGEVQTISLAELFAELIGSRRPPNPFAAELRQMASINDEALKALWDQYDGCNDPGGFSGEAIHMALNLRGLGGHCAV